MEPKPPKMGFEEQAAQVAASVGDDLWELHSAAQKIAEFTSGRTLSDFSEVKILQAVALSMLQVMDAAAVRIESQSLEIGKRLEGITELHALMGGEPGADKVWQFIEGSLPALLSSAEAELEQWHSG